MLPWQRVLRPLKRAFFASPPSGLKIFISQDVWFLQRLVLDYFAFTVLLFSLSSLWKFLDAIMHCRSELGNITQVNEWTISSTIQGDLTATNFKVYNDEFLQLTSFYNWPFSMTYVRYPSSNFSHSNDVLGFLNPCSSKERKVQDNLFLVVKKWETKMSEDLITFNNRSILPLLALR